MDGPLSLFVFAAAAVLACPAARADPSMPMGFEAQTTNATGRTWRETGLLAQPYAMAKASVRSSMLGQGYALVHDISEGPTATRSLQLWRRADEDAILMLWQEDLYSTGVAWGLSARGDVESEAGLDVADVPPAEDGPHAEFAESVSRAELPESVPHAESVESAELVSWAERAENAENGGEDGSASSSATNEKLE